MASMGTLPLLLWLYGWYLWLSHRLLALRVMALARIAPLLWWKANSPMARTTSEVCHCVPSKAQKGGGKALPYGVGFEMCTRCSVWSNQSNHTHLEMLHT